MRFAVIDCGTTNSRVYVLDEDLHVVAKGTKKVGVRDTALTGSSRVLQVGLQEIFEATVREAGLTVQDLECGVASGMITSELGLLEIPHLWAPAGIQELAARIVPLRSSEVFSIDIELLLIPGIKNRNPADATYTAIRTIDFMRGEETQIIGLLSVPGTPAPPFTAVVLSSHTKYVSVTREGRIGGSLTTLSGQVFEAILQGTSIGKSVEAPDAGPEVLDPQVIETAYDSVTQAGFLRTLLMPRFMDVLLKVPAALRRLFLHAAIATEDLQALRDFPLLGLPVDTPFVLIGHPTRCRVLRYLLNRYGGSGREIYEVTTSDEIDRLSILGAAGIACEAGYLKEVGLAAASSQ